MGQMSSAMFQSDQRALKCRIDVVVGLLVSSSELTMDLGARLCSKQSLVSGKQVLTARLCLAKLSFGVVSQ